MLQAGQEKMKKKARTDDGPGRASDDPMSLSIPVDDKKHGLEVRRNHHQSVNADGAPKRQELRSHLGWQHQRGEN